MFHKAVKVVEKGLYGVLTTGPNKFNKGTGFAINEKHIITNRHLLYEEYDITNKRHSKLEVILNAHLGSNMTLCELIYEDMNVDLCILEIIDPDMYCKDPLSFSSSPNRLGDLIGTLGYPFDLKNSAGAYLYNIRFLMSSVSYLREDVLETDQEMYSGSSGSPLFDLDGRVVALHYATKLFNGEMVDASINIPCSVIVLILDSLGIPYSVK